MRLAAAFAASLAYAGQAFAAPPPIATSVPDPAMLQLPDLSAPLNAADVEGADKYFFFHRDNTTFEQALADIRECDGYARGLASPYGYQEAPYPYAGTFAGAAGGIIGNLLVAAIFGSAELRKERRTNLRRCMNYKGYDRYALPKDVWTKFNFEEGLSSVKEDDRQRMLALQAKAASGPQPSGKVLGR